MQDRQSPKILHILSVVTILVATVDSHGLMTSPKPRALVTAKLNIMNSAGWPVKAGGSAKKKPCLDFKSFTPTDTLKVGASNTIQLRANDGANHVGTCKLFLVNPDQKSETMLIDTKINCMGPGDGKKGDSPIEPKWSFTIPSDKKLPCKASHCVLRFDWEAKHITPHEFYDSCADVKLDSTGKTTDSSSGTDTSSGMGPEPTKPKSTGKIDKTSIPDTEASGSDCSQDLDVAGEGSDCSQDLDVAGEGSDCSQDLDVAGEGSDCSQDLDVAGSDTNEGEGSDCSQELDVAGEDEKEGKSTNTKIQEKDKKSTGPYKTLRTNLKGKHTSEPTDSSNSGWTIGLSVGGTAILAVGIVAGVALHRRSKSSSQERTLAVDSAGISTL